MSTHHDPSQVTEDAALTSSVRIRAPRSEAQRLELLEALAETFDDPATAGVDWDILRQRKQRGGGLTAGLGSSDAQSE